MRFQRRLFLGLGIGWSLVARGAIAGAIGGFVQQGYPLTALPGFLDILIPRDETGSATDFGVDRRIVEGARGKKNRMDLLQMGCRWLDTEARKAGGGGFSDLDPASQEEIVARAAASPAPFLPRIFFERTRALAMQAYYGEPAIWADLGFRGPPQPVGYPDHAEPPR